MRGLEQSPNTESRWAQLARKGHQVMQFLSAGLYVGNVLDGKVTSYGGRKKSARFVRNDGVQRGRPDEVGGSCGTKAATRPRISHTVRRLRFPHPNRSRIEVVRGATTSSCFRFGIPSGHSSGSHSINRAISFTRRFPAAIEGGRRISSRPKGLFGFAVPSR